MSITQLHNAGEVTLDEEKAIVVQRVHIQGGRVDEVRLEGREYVSNDRYEGFTKQALVCTSPAQALELADLLKGEAENWQAEIDAAAKPSTAKKRIAKKASARKTTRKAS